MSDRSSPGAPRIEVAFFGTVTASLSHELKNVLATIGELNGLLYDLALVAGPSRPVDPERIKSVCEKVSAQTTRGESLVALINRFSHSVDEPVTSVELTHLVRDTVDLSRRFAYLGQVHLEAEIPEQSVHVSVDPFTCMYAVFLGIQLALSTASEQRKVRVVLHVHESGPEVVIESADPFDGDCAPGPELQLLESLVKRLRGKLVWTKERDRDRLCLSLC